MNTKNILISLSILGVALLFILGMFTPGGSTFLNNAYLNGGFIFLTMSLLSGIIIADFGNQGPVSTYKTNLQSKQVPLRLN